jgi:hypothetical protein
VVIRNRSNAVIDTLLDILAHLAAAH